MPFLIWMDPGGDQFVYEVDQIVRETLEEAREAQRGPLQLEDVNGESIYVPVPNDAKIVTDDPRKSPFD